MTNGFEKNSAFEKRIKKHVIGKPHRFMAVAPLGFESTLVDELEYIGIETIENASVQGCIAGKNSNESIKNTDTKATGIKVVGDGKVEFTAKITEAWKAVAYSRIANRVLMEIDSFKAENFGQLEKGAAGIPWELYLPHVILNSFQNQQSYLTLHVTCKHSRLYHSDAVEERIRKAISGSHADESPADPHVIPNSIGDLAKQHLYVTLIDDRCTIWLDLAGEELYKRGHERFVAEAPLKETIAAAMIFEACRIKDSGYRSIAIRENKTAVPQSESLTTSHKPQTTIIDPMAGSGTFSLEAAYIANGLIPGKCRDFALKHQPAFKEATWNFLVNSRKCLVDSGERHSNNQLSTSYCLPPTIITSDISQRPIDIIKHNVECSPLAEIARSNPDAVTITPQLKDFFSYTIDDFCAAHSPASLTANHSPQITLLLNPPYGKRLAFDAPKLYTQIGQKLTEWSRDAQARGQSISVAILVPTDDCTKNFLKACPAMDPKKSRAKLIKTSHGGFDLNCFIY